MKIQDKLKIIVLMLEEEFEKGYEQREDEMRDGIKNMIKEWDIQRESRGKNSISILLNNKVKEV